MESDWISIRKLFGWAALRSRSVKIGQHRLVSFSNAIRAPTTPELLRLDPKLVNCSKIILASVLQNPRITFFLLLHRGIGKKCVGKKCIEFWEFLFDFCDWIQPNFSQIYSIHYINARLFATRARVTSKKSSILLVVCLFYNFLAVFI